MKKGYLALQNGKIFELKKQLVSGGSSSQNEAEEINGINFVAKKLEDTKLKTIQNHRRRLLPSDVSDNSTHIIKPS